MTAALPLQASPECDAINGSPTWAAHVVLFLLAAIPTLMVATTWDSDGVLSLANYMLRHYHLPVLAVEIAIIFLCARNGWNPFAQLRDLSITLSVLLCAWLAFVVAVSPLRSAWPVISIFFAGRYIIHLMLLGGLINLLQHNKAFNTLHWLSWLSFGAVVYIAMIVAATLTVDDVARFPWRDRLPSATNIRQIGNTAAILIVAPIVISLLGPKPRYYGFLFITLVGVTFICWTGSRGALLGLAAGISTAMVLCWSLLRFWRVFQLALAGTAGAALSIFMPSPNGDFGMFRIVETLGSGEVSSGRTDIWQNTIRAIAQSPLLGHGAGTFRGNMAEISGQAFNHPHNFILQFVYDWGLIGGGAAALMIGWLGISLLRVVEGTARFAAIAGFGCVVTMAMIDGVLFYPFTIVMTIALLAPALSTFQGRYTRHRTQKPAAQRPLADQ